MAYTPCRGWKQPPAHVYKPVRRRLLYNGKEHRDPGYGLCPSCQRVTSILDTPGGQNYVGRHSPKHQTFDERKRRHWEAYDRLNPKPRLHGNVFTQAQWTGYMPTQSITMTNNATMAMAGNATTMYQPINLGTPVIVEVSSDTQNAAGQWVFNINGQTVVASERRLSIATDYMVWNNWSNSITVSANTQTTVWNNWAVGQQHYIQQQAVRRPAYDQVARANDLFRRVEREVEREARAEAALRAQETLFSLLTEEQQREYAERKHFHVRGSRGRLYRIKHGSSGNIRRVRSVHDGDREEAAFCVHSMGHTRPEVAEEVGIVAGHLPHEDHMIQQMLHLMIDEDEILAQANVHWGTREPAPDYAVLDSGLLVAN